MNDTSQLGRSTRDPHRRRLRCETLLAPGPASDTYRRYSIIVARLPARPTTSTNIGSSGLPIRAFSSQGPSMAKRSCDRTTGVVLRGTESLLTHRWREVDSNFRFRAR
jgi:hypothetical protein